jgi:hypothetical protein
MRTTTILAGAVATVAATLGPAPGALAANAVFGGSTRSGEAIVLTADRKAAKLRSAVIAWEARCGDGMTLPVSSAVTATKGSPGFSAGPEDLKMSRNGKQRFSGRQAFALDGGDSAIKVVVKLTGKLGRKAAAGNLSAEATVIDKSSGATRTTCRTGNVRWKASRAPGRVYGGKTSQDEPFVAKVDARRKRVTDVLVGWASACQPNGYLSYPDQLSNFALASSGRFADTWDHTVKLNDGGALKFAYSLTGRLSRRSGAGTFRAAVTGTDAGGATTHTCDTGAVTWKAATG